MEKKKSQKSQGKTGGKRISLGKVSLQTELVVWSVGILLFFMGIQIEFTHHFAQNYAIYEKERQMAELMDRLIDSYSEEVMDIYDIVETYQDVENLRIMIFGEELLIYHSSSVEKAPTREGGYPSVPTDNSGASGGQGNGGERPSGEKPRGETSEGESGAESFERVENSENSERAESGEMTETSGENVRPTGGSPNRSVVMPEIPEMAEQVGSYDHVSRLEGWISLDLRLPEGFSVPSDFSFRNELPSNVVQMIESNVVSLEETFEYLGEERTILIWSSVVAIDSAVSLFIRVNTIVSVVLIFVTVVCVVILSQKLIEPITTMEKVADAVANLDFSSTAPENVRTRELTHLAQSVNLMSETLEQMIGELNQDNRALTDKVENQEKLEQMRRQFVANISHEMKTPLSMLMMYSESLKSDLPGMDKTFYYDTIIEEAAGLNAMVEQLLDTSAVENGLATMDMVEVNFSEFISEFLGRMSPLYGEYAVSMEIEGDIFIKGDRKYLEQAVRNYVTNAISHTEKGKEIRISLEKRGETVVFTVENRGNAMAEEDIPYLWDSFYRGDKSRTKMGGEKRVGLGLYIVKTCISSHFGTVGAENRGEFVAFWFEVPVCLA